MVPSTNIHVVTVRSIVKWFTLQTLDLFAEQKIINSMHEYCLLSNCLSRIQCLKFVFVNVTVHIVKSNYTPIRARPDVDFSILKPYMSKLLGFSASVSGICYTTHGLLRISYGNWLNRKEAKRNGLKWWTHWTIIWYRNINIQFVNGQKPLVKSPCEGEYYGQSCMASFNNIIRYYNVNR